MTPGDTGQPISDDLPTKIPQRLLAEISAKIASFHRVARLAQLPVFDLHIEFP
jgi:hypothetical protein